MSSPYDPSGQRAGQPLRKGLAVTSLVLGILSLFTLGLLGVGAAIGLILGIVALVRVKKQPTVYTGQGMAIAGVVTNGLGCLMFPIVGILAAIAIPSLLRARVSANEASAIGDVRTVISAEMAYESAAGTYGPPECLVAPSATGCITGYPATGPTFLDARVGSLTTRTGYVRAFVPGAPLTTPLSPSGIATFCYSAVPATAGQTGIRSFAGDQTGRICQDPTGANLCTDGMLPEGCSLLGR